MSPGWRLAAGNTACSPGASEAYSLTLGPGAAVTGSMLSAQMTAPIAGGGDGALRGEATGAGGDTGAMRSGVGVTVARVSGTPWFMHPVSAAPTNQAVATRAMAALSSPSMNRIATSPTCISTDATLRQATIATRECIAGEKRSPAMSAGDDAHRYPEWGRYPTCRAWGNWLDRARESPWTGAPQSSGGFIT